LVVSDGICRTVGLFRTVTIGCNGESALQSAWHSSRNRMKAYGSSQDLCYW
jgi:hypothetical protein